MGFVTIRVGYETKIHDPWYLQFLGNKENLEICDKKKDYLPEVAWLYSFHACCVNECN